MAVDYVCAVWSAPDQRWLCAAVSRVLRRIEVCGHVAILAGGHARFLVAPADDVEAAEAMAAALPPPEQSVVDVIVSAVNDGRMVRIELPPDELN